MQVICISVTGSILLGIFSKVLQTFKVR